MVLHQIHIPTEKKIVDGEKRVPHEGYSKQLVTLKTLPVSLGVYHLCVTLDCHWFPIGELWILE